MVFHTAASAIIAGDEQKRQRECAADQVVDAFAFAPIVKKSKLASTLPTMIELCGVIESEASAVGFLIEKGVLDDFDFCPLCKGVVKRINSNPKTSGYWSFRCRSRPCNNSHGTWSSSIFKNSILSDCRFEKNVFVQVVWLWLVDCTNTQVQKMTGLSSATVTDWITYIRECCALAMTQNAAFQIGGPGVIVEIDESKFGKRKYNRGHHVEGNWVFGGTERIPDPTDDNPNKCRAGRCFAIVVETRDKDTLLPLIRSFIAPGTCIISDGWAAYKTIKKMPGCNYTHQVVNHSKCFKDPITGAHTNTCEGMWYAQFKRHIPGRNYTSELSLQDCIFERMWKANNRDNLWDGFWALLSKIRYEDQLIFIP